MIIFFVAMDPRGKQRARVTRRGTYTPQETVDAERQIGWEAKIAMNGRKPFEGPVRLMLEARFSYPKSWSAKRRQTFWRTSKPDVDNIAKLKDALKGIVWVDDAQVVELLARKFYVNERPGLSIQVGSMDDEPPMTPAKSWASMR